MVGQPSLPVATLTLRTLRESAGLSQEAFARLLSVSRMSVIRWERGSHRPSSAHISAMAKVLGVHAQLVLDALDGAAA